MERGFREPLRELLGGHLYFSVLASSYIYSNNGGMYITGERWELNMLHPGY